MLNRLRKTRSNVERSGGFDRAGAPQFRLRRTRRLRVGTQPDPSRRDNSADNEGLTISRAQQGDEQAFEALFNAHKRRVYSLCLRMTRDAIEAEDLTQEAFLHLFRKISSFRGESAFGTWLHRLVVNVVLMRLRKKVLRQVPLEEAGYSREDPVERDTGHREFPARQYGHDDACLTGSVDRITIRRAISELPEGYRTIFVLHDVEGYEHNEIARLRRCSVGNSKSQLHKARVKLRELLRHGPAAKRATVRALNTIVAQTHRGNQSFESRLRAFGRQARPVTS